MSPEIASAQIAPRSRAQPAFRPGAARGGVGADCDRGSVILESKLKWQGCGIRTQISDFPTTDDMNKQGQVGSDKHAKSYFRGHIGASRRRKRVESTPRSARASPPAQIWPGFRATLSCSWFEF